MTDNEEWSREFALDALKEAVRSIDGEYDDEARVFFAAKFGDDSLIVTVTDATDDSLNEEFIVKFD